MRGEEEDVLSKSPDPHNGDPCSVLPPVYCRYKVHRCNIATKYKGLLNMYACISLPIPTCIA